jgi:hypothetical protein
MNPDFRGAWVVGEHTSQSGQVHIFVSRHEVIGASLQPSRSFDTHPAPTPREIPHHVMLTQSGLRPRGVCVLLGHGVSATSTARAAASSERALLPHRTGLPLSSATTEYLLPQATMGAYPGGACLRALLSVSSTPPSKASILMGL